MPKLPSFSRPGTSRGSRASSRGPSPGPSHKQTPKACSPEDSDDEDDYNVQSSKWKNLGEQFIIIDPSHQATWRILGDITATSVGRQVIFGGLSGCFAAYLTKKFSNSIGFSVAATFVLFEIAQHKGYININWTQLQRALTKAKARARMKDLQTKWIRKFVEQNTFLTLGFAGGFAISFLYLPF